jgi:hypothetical protein
VATSSCQGWEAAERQRDALQKNSRLRGIPPPAGRILRIPASGQASPPTHATPGAGSVPEAGSASAERHIGASWRSRGVGCRGPSLGYRCPVDRCVKLVGRQLAWR